MPTDCLSDHAYHGSVEDVKRLVSAGVDVNASPDSTALQNAACVGNEEIVSILLAAGADMNVQHGYLDCPLVEAASRGHTKIAQQLLRNGANVNNFGESGRTALSAAAANGDEALVDLFLSHRAHTNTSLSAAAKAGHVGIAQKPLTAGAKVTPEVLMDCVQSGSLGMVRLLLANGADVKAALTKESVLQRAAEVGNSEVFQELVNFGAQPDADCLYSAARKGNNNIITLLLLHSDISVNAESRGASALEGEGRQQTVELLLERGADVNQKGGYYGSPLQAAIAGKHEATVSTLLRAGADPNVQGGPDGNALRAAIRVNEKLVALMLKAGASVDETQNSYSLQYCAKWCRKQALIDLLDAGADVNAKGGPYGSVLLAAVESAHPDVVRMLLERGADGGDRVVMDAARKRRNDDIIGLVHPHQRPRLTSTT